MEYFYINEVAEMHCLEDNLKFVLEKQIDLVKRGKCGIFLSLRLEDVLHKLEEKKFNCYLLSCSKMIKKKTQLSLDSSWVQSVSKITTDPVYPYQILEKNVSLSYHEIDFSGMDEQIQRCDGLITKYNLASGDVIYYLKIFVLQKTT